MMDIKKMLLELQATVASAHTIGAGPKGETPYDDTLDMKRTTGNDLNDALNAEDVDVVVTEKGKGGAGRGQDEGGGEVVMASNVEERRSRSSSQNKDYKAEMDEYTYGSAETERVAIRGRGGSVDLVEGEGQQSKEGDADAMAIVDLIEVEKTRHFSTEAMEFESKPLSKRIVTGSDNVMAGLFMILNNASAYSLAVLQVRLYLEYIFYAAVLHIILLTSDW